MMIEAKRVGRLLIEFIHDEKNNIAKDVFRACP